VSLLRTSATIAIVFDLPEAAALMSSLAVLGPSVSESAASAMRKLAEALNPTNSTVETSPASSRPSMTAATSAISDHAAAAARPRRHPSR